MTSPILAHDLQRLRADFNSRFPNRDTTTDGWIGDAAHQDRVSGHNPDDTVGSKPESTDADSIPEVRAIDVDKDLREDGMTMLKVIQEMLETQADLDRLLYIIHNRIIWSASYNWESREYTGSNTHEEHAHFSGDPDKDEDVRPWSVLTIGKEMTQSDVIVAESVLWDKAANRSDPTGRNFANDVYAVVSAGLNDEFTSVGQQITALGTATTSGFAQVAGILSSMQSKQDAMDAKLDQIIGYLQQNSGSLTLTAADHLAIKEDVKAANREGTGE